MKIVRTKIPFLPPRGYNAITIGCFIFVHDATNVDERLLTHEGIHWAQEKELLIIGFYLLYVVEFCRNFLFFSKRMKGFAKIWKTAYRWLSFEREAQDHEQDCGYLPNRPHYEWLQYWR